VSVKSERRKRQEEGLVEGEKQNPAELPIESQDIEDIRKFLSQPKVEKEFRSWLSKKHIHTKEEGGNE